MTPTKSYIICTNPRSGSWLLAEGLGFTKVAGNPREWFEVREETKWCDMWKIPVPAPNGDFSQYFHHMMREGTTRNGVFGIKMMAYQFEDAQGRLATLPHLKAVEYGSKRLAAAFPNPSYIWLIRKNKVRQAVSYARATQSDKWWDIEGVVQNERPNVYNEPQITGFYNKVLKHEKAWQLYFQNNNIQPLILYYEDLDNDYEGVVKQTLGFIGVENHENIAIKPTRLKKQADEKTEEWVERYVLHLQNTGQPITSW